jgi:hypothetical protein
VTNPKFERVTYKLFGKHICSNAFMELLSVSKRRFWDLVRALKQGRITPPLDGRKQNGQNRERSAWQSADSFFLHLYEQLAEHLAEGEIAPTRDPEFDEEMCDGSSSGSSAESAGVVMTEDFMSRMAVGAARMLPVKWLANTTRTELFAQYQFWHLSNCQGEVASTSTFRQVWMHHWRGTIRIRHKTQHSRCRGSVVYPRPHPQPFAKQGYGV